jgi:chitin disaccharide deacetylase
VPIEQKSLDLLNHSSPPALRGMESTQTGVLILNADDWGRDPETTERIFECFRYKTISSVSAMVFMEDSERAAGMAREHGVDAGLHLNFTSPFLAANCPARLVEHQRTVAKYLTRNPFARGIYNPWLVPSFEYVVAAQVEEFVRLYGAAPERLDGHHHMHLSANVLLGGLLPLGTIVRRHFSHEPRERVLRHRVFRLFTDAVVMRRYRVADFFFPLIPLEPPARLQRIFALAGRSVVEVETHPVNPEEYRFLAGGEIFRLAGDTSIAHSYEITRGRAGK